MEMRKLILASGSPRRRELLEAAGYTFTIDPSAFDEGSIDPNSMPPHELAQLLSLRKAQEVAARHPGCVVLAADTFIVLDGEILGKPHTPEEARRMLSAMSGRTHKVITGYTIIGPAHTHSDSEESSVQFKQLTQDEITDYINTGEPLDKAGAYAIQGLASKFVAKLTGDIYNVIGLPVAKVIEDLKQEIPPTKR